MATLFPLSTPKQNTIQCLQTIGKIIYLNQKLDFTSLIRRASRWLFIDIEMQSKLLNSLIEAMIFNPYLNVQAFGPPSTVSGHTDLYCVPFILKVFLLIVLSTWNVLPLELIWLQTSYHISSSQTNTIISCQIYT